MTESVEPGGVELITVHLDASKTDLGEPASVAEQVPLASSLPPGTRVIVPAAATRDGGLLRRLLRQQRVLVSRSARCTALLVRGYVEIGADDAEAWGYAPAP